MMFVVVLSYLVVSIAATLINNKNILRICISTSTALSILFQDVLISSANVDAIDAALKQINGKTYSNNMKNFARMAEGDYSMGRKDTSTTFRAKKRLAVNACKNEERRKEADVSESECFKRTMEGDIDFMLKVLKKE